MSLSEVFDRIYQEDRWHGGPSRSGPGSGDQEIAELAPTLAEMIAELGVTSVLDIGCGEGYWMPDLPGYVGIDVSEEALRVARERHPDRDYRHDDGPYPGVDAAICRTVIQHLSYVSGLSILERVRTANIRYFIATTYPNGHNQDLSDGNEGYWVNMRQPPFSLREPLATLRDSGAGNGDHEALLAVFDLA